jgi:multidrug efflux pump subunit AcrA (membrane-fusion protein)
MYLSRPAVAVVLATFALDACGGSGGPHGPPPLSVDVATAQRQTIATYVTLDGQIAPLEQSNLAFQQSGTVIKINVNIGDVVSEGQLLSQIDPSVLQAQVSQANASANQYSASAKGAEVGLPVQIQTNEANLRTAKANLDQDKLIYTQDQALYKQGYVSQTTLQTAQAAYISAQQAYNSAVVGLANNVVSTQNVKAEQAQAVSARAQAQLYSTQLSQTYMYSPYEGVVTNRLMDPGAYASPSQPVLSVARIDKVWVNINVPDEDLAYVRPGVPVTFVSSSLPGKTFNATIQTVNAVPTSGTLSYLARIDLVNPGLVLRGGMLITTTVVKQKRENAIVVPRSAVAQTENGNAVFLVQDGKAVQVPVEVGIQTDTLSQVISPKVQPGDVVITTRPDSLKDGSPVAVNNGSAAPGGAPGAAPAASGSPAASKH